MLLIINIEVEMSSPLNECVQDPKLTLANVRENVPAQNISSVMKRYFAIYSQNIMTACLICC